MDHSEKADEAAVWRVATWEGAARAAWRSKEGKR
jgi:hypothetical protein